jgi:hypothetical protein
LITLFLYKQIVRFRDWLVEPLEPRPPQVVVRPALEVPPSSEGEQDGKSTEALVSRGGVELRVIEGSRALPSPQSSARVAVIDGGKR